MKSAAPIAKASGHGGKRGQTPPPHGAMQERLVSCIAEQIDVLQDEVRDTRLFGFITADDPHLVDDMRRAAAWVASQPAGAGAVTALALKERQPRALERLPRVAIAQALGRLHRKGTLGMPTFEHPANAELMRDLRERLSACTRGQVAVGDIQERVMRAVAGEAPTPASPVGQVARLVEELAARPVGNERDLVAMALELALEGD